MKGGRVRTDAALAQAFRAFVAAIPLTVAWTVAGVHIAIGIAAAIVLVRAAWTRTWTLRRTPMDAAMLAFAAAYVLATLTSADRAASAYTLRKLLLFLVVHFVVAAADRPDRVRWCVRVFVGGIALTALVAAARFLIEQHVSGARLRSTGHYMTFAGLLLFATPLAVAAAASARGRLRAAYAAASGILLGALVLSFTRGAWLGVTVGLAAIVARRRPRLVLLVPLAVVLAFALAPGAYRARAISSFDPQHPLNQDRLRLWRAAAALWRDHPWTGVGLVDLKPYYLQYRHGSEGQVHGHFHNNVLQILVTTGVAGLLAFLWLLVVFGRACWGPGPLRADAELRAAQHGIWGAYCGFLVMGLFEWNFGDVEVTIALCFLVGTAWAAARRAFPAPAADLRTVAASRGGSVSPLTTGCVAATTFPPGTAPASAAECETIGTVPDSVRGPRPPSHVTFGPGEKLTFSIQYGLITAGEATLEIEPQIKIRQDRPTYHVVSQAGSNAAFSAVFRVRDRVESYMDTLHLHSVRFEKHLREGDYKKDLWITFDQEHGKALIDGQRECDVEPHVQDILSSMYYVRTLALVPGTSVYVPNHDNGKNYPLEVRVEERERVTVDAGTFDCLVLEPVLMGEAVFKQNGRIKIWVTDDELHLPVLLKSKVFVGAIAGVLTHFELGGRYRDGKPPAMVVAR